MLLHVILLLYKLSCTVHGEGTGTGTGGTSTGAGSTGGTGVRSAGGKTAASSAQDRIVLEIPETGEYEDDNKPSTKL